MMGQRSPMCVSLIIRRGYMRLRDPSVSSPEVFHKSLVSKSMMRDLEFTRTRVGSKT